MSRKSLSPGHATDSDDLKTTLTKNKEIYFHPDCCNFCMTNNKEIFGLAELLENSENKPDSKMAL